MIREAFHRGLVGACAACVVLGAAMISQAEPPQNGNGGPQNNQPVYQRHGSGRGGNGSNRWRGNKWQSQWNTPQVSGSWFQRPYPYHLDYYKMRYGGSYAPYFGNLYGTPFGTPQVVNNGNVWAPGAGGWGPESGAPAPGVEWSGGEPYAYPPGAAMGQAVQGANTNNQATGQPSNGESLPAPTK